MKRIKYLATIILMITTILILNTKVEASTGKVNVETVRVRKEATTKSVIVTQLDKGEQVEILEEIEDWYKVTFTDKELGKITGYISKQLLDVKKEEVPDSKPEENTNTTNTDNNTSNSENNEKPEENVEQPNDNEIPTYISTNNVEENGEYNITKEITVKILPLVNSLEKVKISSGKIKVIEIINDWCRIENETEIGWIRKNTLKKAINNEEVPTQPVSTTDVEQPQKPEEDTKIPEEPVNNKPEENTTVIKTGYVNTDSLKVRKEASTTSEMIDSLKKNDQVSIIEELEGWYKIKISGETGYVSSKYISDKKVVETTSRGTDNQRSEETTTAIENEKVEKPVNQTSSKGKEVVEYAKQYLGYRYISGGSTPSTGFDCSGFTTYVYKNFGVTLNRSSKDQIKNGTAVEKNNLQLGDIVVFNGDSNKSIGHVGIYIGNGDFIHASNPSDGVKITALSSSYYKSRYVGARRVI